MSVRVLALFAAPLLGGVGCDSSSTHNPPDAPKPPVDAASPDAPFFAQYKAPEGGEVRFEYINLPGSVASIRVTAFTYKTAGTIPYFPTPNLQSGECFNGSTPLNMAAASDRWPDAQNPTNTRVYEDPGLMNGGVVISGGPTAFTAKLNTADGFDGLHRSHPANHYSFFFGGATANDAATYAGPDQAYTVTFPGSAQSFDSGGAAIPPQVFSDVLWMPAAYTLLSPPAGTVAITANTAMTFTWDMPTQHNPADHEIFALVGFTGPMGLSTICIYPNTGSITVPASAINDVIAKYPTGGVLARQTLTHVVKELVDANGPTGNRIDFVTIWCNSAPFTVN